MNLFDNKQYSSKIKCKMVTKAQFIHTHGIGIEIGGTSYIYLIIQSLPATISEAIKIRRREAINNIKHNILNKLILIRINFSMLGFSSESHSKSSENISGFSSLLEKEISRVPSKFQETLVGKF